MNKGNKLLCQYIAALFRHLLYHLQAFFSGDANAFTHYKHIFYSRIALIVDRGGMLAVIPFFA